MNAYAAAEATSRAEDLHRELSELFVNHDTSGTPDATVIPATFLQVTVSL